MTMWAADNTEGFSQAELNMLNRVLERVFYDNDELEPESLNDALNNAWHEGITEAELEASARKWLGLRGGQQ